MKEKVTKKLDYRSEKIKSLENALEAIKQLLNEANIRAEKNKEDFMYSDSQLNKVERKYDELLENEENKKKARVIGKLIHVEKLRNGFGVREMSERSSVKINSTGKVDLAKDVAMTFVEKEGTIAIGAIQPFENLLKESMAGGKCMIEISVYNL